MDNNIVLKMEKICKYYPGVTALDHVDFELRKGEVHALLGENGAGKSTLCKIIAGAQPMDDGSYCLDGEQIRTLTPQSAKDKGVSMIYQEFNLVPYLKVYENMFLGKEIERGIYADKRAMIRKTREVFERFHIEIDPNSRISDLSNAYKQQVEIAKAVLENAKVLIMDEPTAPLGNREVENLFEMIRTLKSEGVSIIYISHRLEELFEISDRITVMRDGQYIETLNTKDTNKSALVKLMVGRDLSEDYPQRSTPIGEEVLRVEHLSTVETKLHDVSFTLHKGEILGFAGLVGAGRTEVMRALFGADHRSSGTVYVGGKQVEILRPIDAIHHGIALIPEDRKGQGVSLTLSIRENISLVMLHTLQSFLRISRKKERTLVDSYMNALAVKAPSMEQLTKNLSGGNQQKVFLARWLDTDADILLLDNPTQGIDIGAKAEIYRLILKLASEGKTILLNTLEIPEIKKVADRCIVFYNGKIAGSLAHSQIDETTVMSYATNAVQLEEVL